MIYSRIAATLALATLLSGCGSGGGQVSANPFVRNSATQTALAVQGGSSDSSSIESTTPESFPAPVLPATTEAPTAPIVTPSQDVAPPAAPSEAPTPIAETPKPTDAPSPTVDARPTLVVPTDVALSYEERWRRQQDNRQVFSGGPRPYTSSGVTQLWWYDPVAQQSVILGTIRGPFQAQATFRLRGQGVEALEVPYKVNVDYGLTAISPAYLERIKRAGFGDWIEAYVFITPEISPA